MIVCGISTAASDAVFVWLDSESGQPLSDGVAKITLNDAYSQVDLRQTAELIRQHLAEKRTQRVVIRKASTAGKYPAGHIAFRLETLIAIVATCEVTYTSAQRIAAFCKSQDEIAIPDVLKKYQEDAYIAAISEL